MLVGRAIFGFTGDAMAVAQQYIITKWFKGSEIAFAFAISTSFGRLGSTLNSYTVPWLYDEYGLIFLCFVGSCTCAWSLLNGIFLVCVDKIADRVSPIEKSEEQQEEPPFKCKDMLNFSG